MFCILSHMHSLFIKTHLLKGLAENLRQILDLNIFLPL